MSEHIPEQLSPQQELAAIYSLIRSKAEQVKVPIQFPVTIAENNLIVSFFGEDEGTLQFGLFLEGQDYSRKTLHVDVNGNVKEDKIGVLPDFDMTDHEPDFSSISDMDIARIVFGRMVGVLQIESAQ